MVRRGLDGEVLLQVERLFATGTVAGLTEGQLLDRFATRRDESAFEALLQRHGPMVMGVLRRFLSDPNDVDDAFQATFLVLVRKAGTLDRKDLLGNWLYGVAYRVALRARSAGVRRQTRLALADQVEELAGDSRCGPHQSVPEAVLRGEERPLLHEEVNRLPQKYRTPIVLCYFEGLTHDEAAVRLGWPVGTVKGRLARARELLRSRLSRRGVAVSTTAVSAILTSPDLKASVPASLTHLTLEAARAVARGTGPVVTACSAVSLSVASLTEGVIHTMVLSQAKSIVIPVLVAAGVLYTGACVAFQLGGGRGKLEGNRPAGSVPTATAKGEAASSEAEGEASLAQRIVGDMEKLAAVGELNDPESFHTWSLRLLEAERNEPGLSAAHMAAYEGHLKRMRKMHDVMDKRAKAGQVSAIDLPRWQYFVKEAERMLERAKARTGGPEAAGSGMMAGMMGSGGMMGSMMRGGGQAAPGGGISEYSGGSAGGAAEKRAQASNSPVSQSQNKTEASASLAASLAGGGFGGGGADDSHEREQADRINIARLSSAISVTDKNTRNQAILKKLDEPISLRFSSETPLEDVLKQIRDVTKRQDGKPLPIYVDPAGLAEAEKTLSSTVTIDLEDVPLRFSLRLFLKQLGLAYCVRDGVLIISSVDGIHQELLEAQAEQMALNPEKFQGMMGGFGGMDARMRGGMMGTGGMR
jgi:RNA polymerase sigma factor (sigma-70 family)